jgi:hypothetical protein
MEPLDVIREIVAVNLEIKYLLFHRYYAFKHGKYGLKTSIEELMYNDSSTCRVVSKADRSSILSETLLYKASFGFGRENVGILSVTKIGPKTFHLPMIDFSCQSSDDNLRKIREFLRYIGQERGAILYSGNSYQYYGAELINKREWLKFIGNCLLFSGYVDERYVGHCLANGCAVLRVSDNLPKTCAMPKVVSTIG